MAAARALGPTEPDMARLTRHQCRWPIGDPKAPGFGFCGRLRPRGASYCPAHAGLSIDPKATAEARKRARKDRRALSASVRLEAWA